MKTKKTPAPRALADADLGAAAGGIAVGEPYCGTPVPGPFPWPLPVERPLPPLGKPALPIYFGPLPA